MKLSDLKPSITELSPEDALALVEQVQKSRLTTKAKPVKASKPSGKVHGVMSKEGRTWTAWCKKSRDCNAKEPRMAEDMQAVTCKGCRKAHAKSQQEGIE